MNGIVNEAIILRAKMYRKLLDEWQLSPYNVKITLHEHIGKTWVWKVQNSEYTEFIKVFED